MNINLPYVEGTRENLRRIFKYHKIRSTFFTENTQCQLLCKPKDQVATEEENNIVCESECSNYEAVYFGKRKRSLKSCSHKHQRSVRSWDSEKNETRKHCWKADYNFTRDQKNVED